MGVLKEMLKGEDIGAGEGVGDGVMASRIVRKFSASSWGRDRGLG